MNLKTLKTKLSFIKKQHRSNLRLIEVLSGEGMYCTDLETYVHIKDTFGMIDGFQNIETFGILPSVKSDESVSDKDFTAPKKSEQVTVKLDDLFYCNKFSSSDETRLHLNTVAFDNSNMISINCHVLKKYETKKLKNTYLVPRVSIKILEGLVKSYKIKGDITIKFSSHFAFIDTSHFALKARLINRDFPKWQSVIPTQFKTIVTLNSLPRLVDIKPLLDKRGLSVVIECLDGNITLKIPNHDFSYKIGQHSEDFRVGFNMGYIELVRNNMADITLKFNNELSACEINNAIVMPLKV
jgi:DNA polymerase III sliding clamp (beta) subunit (PCNA family)